MLDLICRALPGPPSRGVEDRLPEHVEAGAAIQGALDQLSVVNLPLDRAAAPRLPDGWMGPVAGRPHFPRIFSEADRRLSAGLGRSGPIRPPVSRPSERRDGSKTVPCDWYKASDQQRGCRRLSRHPEAVRQN